MSAAGPISEIAGTRKSIMGGLINPPKPKKPTPSVVIPKTEEMETNDVERRRRGRSQTILTSPKGFLTETSTVPNRKSLLGE